MSKLSQVIQYVVFENEGKLAFLVGSLAEAEVRAWRDQVIQQYPEGLADIHETWVPTLLRDGDRAHAVILPGQHHIDVFATIDETQTFLAEDPPRNVVVIGFTVGERNCLSYQFTAVAA